MSIRTRLISLLFIGSLFIYFSCNNSKKTEASSSKDTVMLWKQNCALCHGNDGKLGINGAKDLGKSELSMELRTEVIKKGRGKMTGFEHALSEKQIEALAKYTFTF